MARVLELTPTPEPVNPHPNTQEDQEEGHHRPSYYSPPPSLTAFPSARASPEAGWEDDVPAADSEDDAEWEYAAAAAADDESEDEAEWEEDIPEAESDNDAAAAAAKSEDEAEREDDVPAAEPEDDAGGEADTGEPDSPPRYWPSNSGRRDPRKAELFRRLDAACEARRLQEARRRKPPPLPTVAGDTDEPIGPPKSPYWRCFRESRATKCSPDNPVLNRDDSSLSRPPSNKSKEMLSDNVEDQRDGTEQSSKSASCQIVPYENGYGKKTLPVPPKRIKHSIDTYAVQCGKCWKWRLVPTKMEYEEIREKSIHDRFYCEHVHGWKPGVSCDDPADISQDDGFWVIDKQCVSEAPLGWERTISIRSEGCEKFADVYYRPPEGKQLRSAREVELFLQANPKNAAGIQPCKDWFQVPEPLHVHVKKRRRQSKPFELNEVVPLSCAPPIHEDLSPKCVLALYDADQY
ncbi:unnamed protein product [Alopecurus aequalis]